MAASTIKGITIEIGGDTTKLDKALSGVNKQSRDLQKELKEVEKGLKLDPKNTELLAQKQTLLKEAVAATSEKLDVLKSAEAQVQKQFENGEVSEEQYRALQREIIKTEADLKNLKTAAEDSNSTLEKAGEIAGKFDMTAATVSYHLSQLKKAGLVFESREKNYIYYSLNASVLEEVLLWLQDLKGASDHEN